MRNVSHEGAKIMLLDKAPVPDTFGLQIKSESGGRPCPVVRRQGEDLGLKFAIEGQMRQSGVSGDQYN